MKTCPFCHEPIPVEARECKFCHAKVVRNCPSCGEEVVFTARLCRFCHNDIAGGGPASHHRKAPLAAAGPVGEDKNIATWVIIALFTCGIGFWVWIFQMAGDVNRHCRQERLNPILDLVLVFLTCGFWIIYMNYKYASVIVEMVRDEGGEISPDLPIMGLVLGFFLPIAGFAVLQHELNNHWRQHG